MNSKEFSSAHFTQIESACALPCGHGESGAACSVPRDQRAPHGRDLYTHILGPFQPRTPQWELLRELRRVGKGLEENRKVLVCSNLVSSRLNL